MTVYITVYATYMQREKNLAKLGWLFTRQRLPVVVDAQCACVALLQGIPSSPVQESNPPVQAPASVPADAPAPVAEGEACSSLGPLKIHTHTSFGFDFCDLLQGGRVDFFFFLLLLLLFSRSPC